MGARRWWILVALIVGLLPFALDLGLVLVAMPSLAQDLPTSRAHAAQLASALPLTLGVLVVFGARALRRVPLRTLLVGGLLIAAAATAAEALAQSTTSLLLARTAVGVGAALALPAALAVVQVAFEPAEHVRAVAIWAGFSGLGAAVAPLLGGLLVDGHRPGSVFAVQVPFLVAGAVLLAVLLPTLEPTETDRSGAGRAAAGPVAIFVLAGTAAVLTFRLQLDQDYSAARTGAVLLVGLTAFSVTARAVAPLVARFGAALTATTGLLALAGIAVVLAYTNTGAALLLVALCAAAALAVGAAPGSAGGRSLAVGTGVAVLGSLPPHAALLLAAAIALLAEVGPHLLRRPRRRSRDLAPP